MVEPSRPKWPTKLPRAETPTGSQPRQGCSPFDKESNREKRCQSIHQTRNKAFPQLDQIMHEIGETLNDRGWARDPLTPWYTKSFESIVGTKEAHVLVFPSANHDGSLKLYLSGRYESEGLNILEPIGVFMPADRSSAKRATAFIDEAEERISKSFAVRLWNSRQVTGEAV